MHIQFKTPLFQAKISASIRSEFGFSYKNNRHRVALCSCAETPGKSWLILQEERGEKGQWHTHYAASLQNGVIVAETARERSDANFSGEPMHLFVKHGGDGITIRLADNDRSFIEILPLSGNLSKIAGVAIDQPPKHWDLILAQ
ncbi:MAG TPA: hypothetical protein DIS76_02520 [Rhodospirillaceae bacterium]|nr:hypothetical protein [Rhodospirillaceae bacterium]